MPFWNATIMPSVLTSIVYMSCRVLSKSLLSIWALYATQMEKRRKETERGNQSKITAALGADCAKEAITPAAQKEIKETKKCREPSAVNDLYTRCDNTLENVKHIDQYKKNVKNLDKWDLLNVERI